MTIPFLDLGAGYFELKDEIDAAVARVLESGWYILGREVEAFEAEFALYCEAKYAVGIGNGLEALLLALKALGIQPGDEVIVPSNTYIATWLAVSELGAVPVPVEPRPDTYNIEPAGIEAVIGPRTRAIIAVHLYGQPADLFSIQKIAKRHGLAVIEDAAQCIGARYHGARIGAHSDVVCWSFYPGKNLGAMGDGGAITTNDGALAERIRMLGNYGSDKKYIHGIKGRNSRLDSIQAAILRVKLAHLDDWNARRNVIAARYLDKVSADGVLLPHVPDWAEPVWHLFVIRSDQREGLRDHLTGVGIGTLIHYPIPPHLQGAYSSDGERRTFSPLPWAERLAQEVLSLPIGPQARLEDIDMVVYEINNFSARG